MKKAKIFFEEYKFVFIFALIVAFAAGFFAWRRADRFNASLSIFVGRTGNQQTDDYKYDGYYAEKASGEFADTVAGWLKTPEVVAAVYQTAGIDFSPRNLSGFSGKFKVDKVASNIIEVRYGGKNAEELEKIAQAIPQVISKKTDLINSLFEAGSGFIVSGGKPVVVISNSVEFNIISGLLIGLVFGFFIQKSKEYFFE